MASYNKVLLMGNLTRDIELKYTPGNMAVADVGLAVNYRYRTKEGEDREETTFVDCEAWGRTAEVMKQYLAKGRPVFIEGRLKLDQWQDKEGNKRQRHKVVIDNFQFIDSRGSQESGGSGGRPAPTVETQSAGAPARTAGAAAPTHQPIAEDDIPF